MADGIKIRDLNQVSDVRNDDVFVLDRKEADSNTSITNHITYADLKGDMFGGDVTIGGDLHVDNINIEGNITIDGGALDLDLALNDLTDVFVPAPQANDFLMYNGTGWVTGQPQTGGGGGDTISPGLTDYIMFNTSSEPVVFKVTVGPKTPSNHLFGIGSDQCYYLNGVEAPNLILGSNRTYIFDQSDITNAGLDLVFYTTKTNFVNGDDYRQGVTFQGTAGIDRMVTIKFSLEAITGGFEDVTNETPDYLHYHSSKFVRENHMGNMIRFDMNTSSLFRSIDVADLQTRLGDLESHVQTLLQLE